MWPSIASLGPEWTVSFTWGRIHYRHSIKEKIQSLGKIKYQKYAQYVKNIFQNQIKSRQDLQACSFDLCYHNDLLGYLEPEAFTQHNLIKMQKYVKYLIITGGGKETWNGQDLIIRDLWYSNVTFTLESRPRDLCSAICLNKVHSFVKYSCMKPNIEEICYLQSLNQDLHRKYLSPEELCTVDTL